MNPVSPDSGELPAPVRQKLAMAQVRLLELTDAREALATQNQLLTTALAEAQLLADARSGERDHLVTINAGLEAHAGNLQAQLDTAHATHQQDRERIAGLEAAAIVSARALADLLKQTAALKATRSWRWTAPFRALGGIFSGRS